MCKVSKSLENINLEKNCKNIALFPRKTHEAQPIWFSNALDDK